MRPPDYEMVGLSHPRGGVIDPALPESFSAQVDIRTQRA